MDLKQVRPVLAVVVHLLGPLEGVDVPAAAILAAASEEVLLAVPSVPDIGVQEVALGLLTKSSLLPAGFLQVLESPGFQALG